VSPLLEARLRSKPRTLRPAWGKVRASCLASDSRDMVRAARAFDDEVERNIERLYRRLQRGTFRFSPAKGVPVGKRGAKRRPIVISDIDDRIVQRALLQVISRLEPVRTEVSNPGSFGGLPGVGVRDAISAAVHRVRDGAAYHIKSDIPGFFTKIPRRRTLRVLYDLLPDRSLDQLLDDATTVELRNLRELGRLASLFPSYEIGVAQGSSLSPMLGNICLADFDREMNSGRVSCLRYIDDFVILAPDKASAWAAFRMAAKLLNELGMDTYDPRSNRDKASEGATRKGFDFLGCSISAGFVQPSREARARLLTKVESILQRSRQRLRDGVQRGEVSYDDSLLETLALVSNTIEGWSKHYSFCNAQDIFAQLDSKTDALLQGYWDSYFAIRRIAAQDERALRRVMGVRLLSDVTWQSVFPT